MSDPLHSLQLQITLITFLFLIFFLGFSLNNVEIERFLDILQNYDKFRKNRHYKMWQQLLSILNHASDLLKSHVKSIKSHVKSIKSCIKSIKSYEVY